MRIRPLVVRLVKGVGRRVVALLPARVQVAVRRAWLGLKAGRAQAPAPEPEAEPVPELTRAGGAVYQDLLNARAIAGREPAESFRAGGHGVHRAGPA